MNITAVAYALAAAALFGMSTPMAKALVGVVDPWLLAGLFYLGSGVGLSVLHTALGRWRPASEAPLARRDIPWLAGAILSGGVAGPILLLIGLTKTEGTTASLLLTMEGVATALIAWFAFRENFDRRIALGMALIVAGAMVLAWQDEPGFAGILGPLLIVGACVAWGIDNNLTRKVALADPLQIAMIKGLVAGPVSLGLAFANGATLPATHSVIAALVVGFLGYGVSLVLFVVALRHLGTARTGAYFSTAPFLGTAVAIPLLHEPLSLQLLAAGVLMGAGVWLHLTERHTHEHEHEVIEHTHRHMHDDHHRHAHDAADPPSEPHSHRHVHVRLRHAHPHVPDAHHRHVH
ncbi:DMT family transporter [Vineibacter terrae]|uniref:DMT family transporter n=1 Tax=Vineibacter terrae TaxID=2586908 RepID=A0A5C8PRV8_9HYPH|nr:DMT family transporter [Vineibacter terrae]TXL77642.1 DMT family transporter [Vineibacter terrae]